MICMHPSLALIANHALCYSPRERAPAFTRNCTALSWWTPTSLQRCLVSNQCPFWNKQTNTTCYGRQHRFTSAQKTASHMRSLTSNCYEMENYKGHKHNMAIIWARKFRSFSLFLSFFVSSVFILMDCAADSMHTYQFLSMR